VRRFFVSILLVLGLFGYGYADEVKTVNVAVPLSVTTGWLCSPHDPDFAEYRYYGLISYCKRSVTESEKSEIAKIYGVPKSEWYNYEFDHLIPLSIGGSDNYHNIWPQILSQSKIKDKVEDEVYVALKEGKITQAQAVKDILLWFCNPCKDINGNNICTDIKIIGLDPNSCNQFVDSHLQALGIPPSFDDMTASATDESFVMRKLFFAPPTTVTFTKGGCAMNLNEGEYLIHLKRGTRITLETDPNDIQGSSLTTTTIMGNYTIELSNGEYLINKKSGAKITIED